MRKEAPPYGNKGGDEEEERKLARMIVNNEGFKIRLCQSLVFAHVFVC